MTLQLPPRLVESAQGSAEGQAWLARLPAERARLARRWSLSFEREGGGHGATCSHVAFVRRSDGTPAVLKIGLPHFEAEHEGQGLRFWNGDPMIQLLEADEASGALLLERCEPGSPLSDQSAPEQDRVIAGLLRRLWRAPPPAHPFRPLSAMVRYWADEALGRLLVGETRSLRRVSPNVEEGPSAECPIEPGSTCPSPAQRGRGEPGTNLGHEVLAWPDAGFIDAGTQRLVELGQPRSDDALLATDLHAGNVLAAARQPWLAIDPKPFVGDRAYDATQHLLNCTPRLCDDPQGTVARFSQLINVKPERVHAWLFARFAAHVQRGRLTFGLTEREVMTLARKHEKLAH